ncbi:50S ribosomal protein L23 [Candidatus Dependentiae bacterium]|nr:50S ribosomal protein L23 [Candidatus Dependentiae bacterium]
MDLTIYDVIKRIYMATKSQGLRDKFGKITFEVHKSANKPMIKEAVEKLWNVKVRDVRTMNLKGKNKTFGRRPFQTPDKKKAIITLKEGYKIDLPQFESMGVPTAKEEAVSSKGK